MNERTTIPAASVPAASRRRAAATVVAAVLSMSLLAAGCGGDRETAEPPAGSPPAAPAATSPGVGAGSLSLAGGGTARHPGQTVAFTWELDAPAGQGAWVGLIPAAVTSAAEADNDEVDVDWVSVQSGSSSGAAELTLRGPGEFRVRLFSSDDTDGVLLAESAPFTVEPWPGEGVTLELTPAGEIAAGETLTVTFELPQSYPHTAWIGLIPSRVTSLAEDDNDAEDVTWGQVQGARGTVELTTDQAGEYAVRLFPCDEAGCDAVAEAGPVRIKG